MRHHVGAAVVMTLILAACGGSGSSSPTPNPGQPRGVMRFFVSSATNTTANLGGLRGADAICQNLAVAVGAASRTWRAYLSVEHDPDNGNRATAPRSRIGRRPWGTAQSAR